MKTLKNKFYGIVIAIAFTIPLILITAGCGCNEPSSANAIITQNETLVAIGIDLSQSVDGFRKVDTSFIARVCRAIAKTGGFIVVYGIGEPNDKSGLRCYLKHVPAIDAELILSQQAEMKQANDRLKSYNDQQIREFIKVVEEQVLGPPRQGLSTKHTDIEGFFKKIDILVGEPETRQMTKYVFAYTDGIQSLDGPDRPCAYNFENSGEFSLCLAGWKTALPSKVLTVKQFEDPEGFAKYMESINSQTL